MPKSKKLRPLMSAQDLEKLVKNQKIVTLPQVLQQIRKSLGRDLQPVNPPKKMISATSKDIERLAKKRKMTEEQLLNFCRSFHGKTAKQMRGIAPKITSEK